MPAKILVLSKTSTVAMNFNEIITSLLLRKLINIELSTKVYHVVTIDVIKMQMSVDEVLERDV